MGCRARSLGTGSGSGKTKKWWMPRPSRAPWVPGSKWMGCPARPLRTGSESGKTKKWWMPRPARRVLRWSAQVTASRTNLGQKTGENCLSYGIRRRILGVDEALTGLAPGVPANPRTASTHEGRRHGYVNRTRYDYFRAANQTTRPRRPQRPPPWGYQVRPVPSVLDGRFRLFHRVRHADADARLAHGADDKFSVPRRDGRCRHDAADAVPVVVRRSARRPARQAKGHRRGGLIDLRRLRCCDRCWP